MDAHNTNYILCVMEPVISEEDDLFAIVKVTSDYKNILMFVDKYYKKLDHYRKDKISDIEMLIQQLEEERGVVDENIQTV